MTIFAVRCVLYNSRIACGSCRVFGVRPCFLQTNAPVSERAAPRPRGCGTSAAYYFETWRCSDSRCGSSWLASGVSLNLCHTAGPASTGTCAPGRAAAVVLVGHWPDRHNNTCTFGETWLTTRPRPCPSFCSTLPRTHRACWASCRRGLMAQPDQNI